jgi:hypothetical protein
MMLPVRWTGRERGASLSNEAQVRLAQHDEMVHALAPDRSDQSFGKAVLPRRTWALAPLCMTGKEHCES